MAKSITVLDAVNEILTRSSVIQSDLSSLTDTSIQTKIDNAVGAIGDVVRQMQKTDSYRGEIAEGTFTLIDGDRTYTIPSDFVFLTGDPVDRTNGRNMRPYPGGFEQLHEDQLIPANFTGQPNFWTIDADDNFYLDMIPDSTVAGNTYTFIYQLAINLTAAATIFPMDDEVIEALFPAFTEWFVKLDRRQWDAVIFQAGMSAAASLQRTDNKIGSWSNRKIRRGEFWPYRRAP